MTRLEARQNTGIRSRRSRLDSRLPSITVELVGRKISWNFGETTATGGLFTRGSVERKRRNEPVRGKQPTSNWNYVINEVRMVH